MLKTPEEIVVEIFAQTGYRVGCDDPVVAACLFFSCEMRNALKQGGNDTKIMLQEVRTALIEELLAQSSQLIKAAETERANAHRHAAQTIQTVERHFITRTQSPGSHGASAVTPQPHTPATAIRKWRNAAVILTSVLSGFALAKAWYSPTPSDERALTWGRAAIAIVSEACSKTNQAAHIPGKPN